MKVRRRHPAIAAAMMTSGLLIWGGCTSLWQEIPVSQDKRPVVRLDASWHAENPSDDQIERLSKDRQEHIQRVLQQRQRGVVGLPLNLDAENAGPAATPRRNSATASGGGSSLILQRKQQDADSASSSTVAAEPTREDQDGLTLSLKWKEDSNHDG